MCSDNGALRVRYFYVVTRSATLLLIVSDGWFQYARFTPHPASASVYERELTLESAIPIRAVPQIVIVVVRGSHRTIPCLALIVKP